MFILRFLIRWAKIDQAKAYLNDTLALSLFFIGDLALSVYLSQFMGLIPIVVSFLTLNLLFYGMLRGAMIKVNHEIESNYLKGIYYEKSFENLAALYAAVPLLLSPGFISLLLGLIIYGPLRLRVGRYLTKKLSIDWKSVYEYLKMEDFQ